MKEYFLLQYKRNNRKLKDFGIAPLLGYITLLFLFIGISNHLFKNYEFASYLYVLASFALTATMSERGVNDFLKMCFSRKSYWILRIVENLLCSLPFLAYLLYKGLFLSSIILIAGTGLFTLLSFNSNYSLTIPTPFYKKPFEFTVGFRKTFFLFPLAYGISVIAITVNNFNLGVFALLLIFLITFSYHFKPENEFYVWNFNLTPEQFLKKKLKTALIFTFVLALPVLLILGFSFKHYLGVLLIITVSGFGFLTAVILAKYSNYPHEINFPQIFVIVLCISFPPFILAVIPYFFLKAKKELNLFLHDTNL